MIRARLTVWFGWRHRALHAEAELAKVRDELRATGHRADYETPLHILVDIAIDTERSRKELALLQAADDARNAVRKLLPFIHMQAPPPKKGD